MAMAKGFWGMASVTVLASVMGAACSAAPPTETSASTDEALCEGCIGRIPIDPPPPPPIWRWHPPVCSWDPLATYPTRCNPPDSRFKPWMDSGSATVQSCVSSYAYDALSVAQKWFMQHGCSAPVYWRAWNPEAGWNDDPGSVASTSMVDQGNAWTQLCPYSNEIDDYAWYGVNGGQTILQANDPDGTPLKMMGDHAPHTSWGFCDSKLPPPPPGYYWVVPWMDPTCQSGGGCMVVPAASKF